MADSTIRRSFDTINSLPDFSGIKSRYSRKERLKPSFFVYENGGVNKIEIDPEESIFHVGTAADNEIVIKESQASSRQMTIVQLDGGCYFVDCGEKDLVQFNGIQKRQEIIDIESRMVIRIGQAWIIYIGLDSHKYDETDSVVLKRSLVKLAPKKESCGDILLKMGDHEWDSHSAPILAGSHNSCDCRFDGQGISPFHFIIYFSPTGLFIEDLTQGAPGIKLNGNPCTISAPMTEDACISINNINIFIYLYGNVDDQCDSLFAEINRHPAMMLTNLTNTKANVLLPKTSRKLAIGRSDENDVIIDNPSMSRSHAQMMIREKYLLIQDNGSTNKTRLNLEPITKAHVLPGDLLQFGDVCFLVHYQVDS